MIGFGIQMYSKYLPLKIRHFRQYKKHCQMKRFLAPFIALVIITSCKKNNDGPKSCWECASYIAHPGEDRILNTRQSVCDKTISKIKQYEAKLEAESSTTEVDCVLK